MSNTAWKNYLKREDLGWQSTFTASCEKDNYLLETGMLSDCTLIVGPFPNTESFKCHKLILAKASSAFEEMFSKPSIDERNPNKTYKFENIDPEIFKITLKFIYTNIITWVSVEACFLLSEVAETFILPNLLQITYNNLLLNIHPGNAIEVYQLSRRYNTSLAQKIRQKSWQVIVEFTNEVITADSFTNAYRSTVLLIVQQNSMNVTEANLIVACERWGHVKGQMQANSQNLVETLGEIFKHLRFLALTIRDLDTIKDCKLLSHDQLLKLRNRIGSIKYTFQYFDEFCSEEIPRNTIKIIPVNFTFTEEKTNYECSSLCGNCSTLEGNGFIYSINFTVDSDIALLGINCAPSCSIPGVKWSVTLSDENHCSCDIAYITGTNIINFQSPYILPRNKKFTLIVMAKKYNTDIEQNISPSMRFKTKVFVVILPGRHNSLVNSIFYSKA